MKLLITLCLCFLLPFTIYCQNNSFIVSDDVFYLLVTGNENIHFESKPLNTLGPVYKFKKREKLKFSIQKDGRKYDFKVDAERLGYLNSVIIKPVLENKLSLSIDNRHVIIKFDYENCETDCFSVNITTSPLILEGEQYFSNLPEFQNHINSNTEFFTQ